MGAEGFPQSDGTTFEDAFRADILVESALLIEIKSAEQTSGLHVKQTLTSLRLLGLGILMNFGLATFEEGVQRIANGHDPGAVA